MREALEEILHDKKKGTMGAPKLSLEEEKREEKPDRGQEERPKEKPKQRNTSAVKESGRAESILGGILIGLGILNVYEIIVGLEVLLLITLPLWIIMLLIWLKVRKKEKGENRYGKN